jgi:hypothetical protein
VLIGARDMGIGGRLLGRGGGWRGGVSAVGFGCGVVVEGLVALAALGVCLGRDGEMAEEGGGGAAALYGVFGG